MRISDWSSDVCSSDLASRFTPARRSPRRRHMTGRETAHFPAEAGHAGGGIDRARRSRPRGRSYTMPHDTSLRFSPAPADTDVTRTESRLHRTPTHIYECRHVGKASVSTFKSGRALFS